MVESNSPSSSATRSADDAGASLGAPPLCEAGPPALERAPPAAEGCPPAEALLAEAALSEAEALLDAALLLEEALLELLGLEELEEALLDDAVCSSSEKSTSSGGSPSLSVDGSGGMRLSCGRWSDSLYTGEERSPRAVGSGMLSPAERLRREEDCSPLREAVLSLLLDSLPELMVGMLELGWLLLVLPGMPWLGWLDELLDGILLLAVCDWLWLLLEELDCDCD